MFADLEEKVIIVLLILAVIGGCVGSYMYRGYEIEKLQKANAVQAVANKELDKTVKIDTGVATDVSQVTIKLDTDKAAVVAKHTEITSKTNKKIQDLDNAFNKDPAPKTQAVIDAEQTQVSTVLINSIWDQY